MSKRRFYSLALGVLLLAFLLRAFGLTDQCLTNDEVIEVEDALRSTWSEILWCPDAFPPLYRVVLAGWEWSFGAGEQTRWLSLLFGMAFVPATMITAFQISQAVNSTRSEGDTTTPHAAALWTGFVTATNPLMIHYAQETRAYMLYLVLAAWNLCFFVRCLRFNRHADWLRFAAFGIVGCYAHYYVGLWLVALGIVWLVSMRMRGESLSGGVLAIGVMAIAGLPLLSFFVPDFRDTVGYAMKAPFSWVAGGYTYFAFLVGFCIGPSRAELHEANAGQLIPQFFPWISLVGLPTCVLVWHSTKTLRPRSRWFWTLLMPAVLPVILAAIFSSVTDLRYGVRYVVACAIPVFCVMGLGLSNITSVRLRMVVAGLFLAVSLLAVYTRNFVPRYKNEDLRSVAALLENHVGDTVFILADYNKRPFRFYSSVEHSLVPLPVPEKTSESIDNRDELDEVVARIEQVESAWIVICRAYHGDPYRLFRDWLEKAREVSVEAKFDGTTVYRFRK